MRKVIIGNIKGPKGDTGPQGSPGVAGLKGDKGDVGETGPSGSIPDNALVRDSDGRINMQGHAIYNVETGSEPDAVPTKAYVDDAVAALSATVVALAPTGASFYLSGGRTVAGLNGLVVPVPLDVADFETERSPDQYTQTADHTVLTVRDAGLYVITVASTSTGPQRFQSTGVSLFEGWPLLIEVGATGSGEMRSAGARVLQLPAGAELRLTYYTESNGVTITSYGGPGDTALGLARLGA